MFNIAAKTFQLGLKVDQRGKLEMVYFGPKLLRPENQLLMIPDIPAAYCEDYFAYPEHGAGDFHEPALFIVHHDGQVSTDLYYVRHKTTVTDTGEIWGIQLKDACYDLEVHLLFRSYYDSDIIEQRVRIINSGAQSLCIRQAASGFLRLKGNRFTLSHFAGSWADEMNLIEEELARGVNPIVA